MVCNDFKHIATNIAILIHQALRTWDAPAANSHTRAQAQLSTAVLQQVLLQVGCVMWFPQIYHQIYHLFMA